MDQSLNLRYNTTALIYKAAKRSSNISELCRLTGLTEKKILDHFIDAINFFPGHIGYNWDENYKRLLLSALNSFATIDAAAKEIGISPRNIYLKIKQYGICRNEDTNKYFIP